jgi:Na+-transporting NADH:ubiquinone oxidoreductase subunit C
MFSNSYIIRFVLVMCVIVAVVLAFMSSGLSEIHGKNEAVFNKRAILTSVKTFLPKPLEAMSDTEVEALFKDKIEQKVVKLDGSEVTGMVAEQIDMAKEKKKPEAERNLPLFIYKADDGKSYYILAVRGSGLWDEIWANIALQDDFNTIAGTSFDHKGETPGLGAEIKDNPAFPAQFVGKKLLDESGNFISINVVKGGVADGIHDVDAISGSTITSKGVQEMLKRGLGYYQNYLNKLKTAG